MRPPVPCPRGTARDGAARWRTHRRTARRRRRARRAPEGRPTRTPSPRSASKPSVISPNRATSVVPRRTCTPTTRTRRSAASRCAWTALAVVPVRNRSTSAIGAPIASRQLARRFSRASSSSCSACGRRSPNICVVLLDRAGARSRQSCSSTDSSSSSVPGGEVEARRCRSRRRVGTRPMAVSTRAGRRPHALEDPLEHAAVLAVAGPEELAVGVLAEPVDVEDLRQLRRVGRLADRQPVREVVAHVVAAERQHRERVAAQRRRLRRRPRPSSPSP